ncbi:MAG: phosphate ABC transporter substrate-binding protein [Methanospirillum sp.]|nr:phosphate ABC transporter substrate-binding protein [Methanospirillum sp.]
MQSHRSTLFLPGLAAVVIGALLVAGCTGTGETATPAPTGPPGGPAGRLSVTGSTTVLPVAQALAERYMDLNSGADIQVSGGGSSVGIAAVGEKTAEIGMASRGLKDAETAKYAALEPVAIARDGIAVIVHPSNAVAHLTLDQVREIYAGNVTNWKDVGGQDRQIVAIGRDSASGTREFFTEKVMGTTSTTATMLEKNSNGAIQSSVAPNPGAIGYVGLGYLDATVRAVPLQVDGTAVEPSIETVADGRYPVARELYFVTSGGATGLAQEFIAFALSGEGQQIVEKEGFIPVAA